MEATVHLNIGEHATADSLCSVLQSQRYQLSSWERRQVEYYQASLRGDAEGAYRQAVAMFERNPLGIATYTAALNASRTNRLERVREYAAQMDYSLPGIANWSGSWSVPASALHLLGDHEAELEWAAQIRQQRPDWRFASVVEYRALIGLGRIDEMEEALQALANSRTPGNLGVTYHTAALELRAHGHGEAAPAMLDRAIRWFRALPPGELEPLRDDLGRVLLTAGRWAEARAEFEILLSAWPQDVEYLGTLGVIAAGSGDRDRALSVSEQLGNLDRPYLFGSNTLWQARIAAMLGETVEAVGLLRRAFSERVYYGLWLHREVAFEPLRDYPPFEELMRPKG
jgi:tetratricopeptide (TPR) repeat protein